jgi:hypothetical protein
MLNPSAFCELKRFRVAAAEGMTWMQCTSWRIVNSEFAKDPLHSYPIYLVLDDEKHYYLGYVFRIWCKIMYAEEVSP